MILNKIPLVASLEHMKLFATESENAADPPDPLTKRFHPPHFYHPSSKTKFDFNVLYRVKHYFGQYFDESKRGSFWQAKNLFSLADLQNKTDWKIFNPNPWSSRTIMDDDDKWVIISHYRWWKAYVSISQWVTIMTWKWPAFNLMQNVLSGNRCRSFVFAQ